MLGRLPTVSIRICFSDRVLCQFFYETLQPVFCITLNYSTNKCIWQHVNFLVHLQQTNTNLNSRKYFKNNMTNSPSYKAVSRPLPKTLSLHFYCPNIFVLQPVCSYTYSALHCHCIAWLLTSAEKQMITVFFWVFTQLLVVTSYLRFGTCRSHLKCQEFLLFILENETDNLSRTSFRTLH
jgi:hypothetical protein